MIVICMTNGGLYSHVRTINGEITKDLNKNKIRKLLKEDILEIEYDDHNTGIAFICTKCISSINIEK